MPWRAAVSVAVRSTFSAAAVVAARLRSTSSSSSAALAATPTAPSSTVSSAANAASRGALGNAYLKIIKTFKRLENAVSDNYSITYSLIKMALLHNSAIY